ncbi:hypothetical protein KCV07_g6835, partial [Aureobasidium melanogenum]
MLVPTPNANGSSQVGSPTVLPVTGQSPATNTTDPSNNPRPNPGRRPATNTITPFTNSRTIAADVFVVNCDPDNHTYASVNTTSEDQQD